MCSLNKSVTNSLVSSVMKIHQKSLDKFQKIQYLSKFVSRSLSSVFTQFFSSKAIHKLLLFAYHQVRELPRYTDTYNQVIRNKNYFKYRSQVVLLYLQMDAPYHSNTFCMLFYTTTRYHTHCRNSYEPHKVSTM